MSRTRAYARKPSRHENDDSVSHEVASFIEVLMSVATEITWHASRECDALRVEATHRGFQIKVTHYVPEEHPDFIVSGSISPGDRKEEVRIEVRDISRQTGLSNVVKESFVSGGPLFSSALELFESIALDLEFIMPASRDKLSYAHAIAFATHQLEG